MSSDVMTIIRIFIHLSDNERIKVLISLYEDIHREEHSKMKSSPFGQIYNALNRLSLRQKKELIQRLEQGYVESERFKN
ncbi:hypothetical protein ACIRXL_04900 [Avibacterium paragallinarum]|uniref:hypothetical protein n=1 Tax=Avibacterium paragallinarum TaxID=728 RepID=UPI00397A299F